MENNPIFKYAMVNRPASHCTAPPGFTLEDRPAAGQLHHDMARNGVAIYDRQLTDTETKQWEMSPMVEGDGLVVYAEAVIGAMRQYTKQYVNMDIEDLTYHVAEKLCSSATGYRPSLNMESLVSLVIKIINESKHANNVV